MAQRTSAGRLAAVCFGSETGILAHFPRMPPAGQDRTLTDCAGIFAAQSRGKVSFRYGGIGDRAGQILATVQQIDGGDHLIGRTEERLLRDWADAMGFRLVRKIKK